MLPPKERLERELQINEHYGIKKDAIQEAVDVFLRSVEYAGLVDDNKFLRLGDVVTAAPPTEADEENKDQIKTMLKLKLMKMIAPAPLPTPKNKIGATIKL